MGADGPAPWRSVEDLRTIAGQICERKSGEALTLPVPTATRGPHDVDVTILRYRQPPLVGREILFAPDFRVDLRADGELVSASYCAPSDLGLPGDVIEPILGFGLDHVTSLEYGHALRRLDALSPQVWRAFGADAHAADSPAWAALARHGREPARAYAEAFPKAVYKPLIPFYYAVAQPFFDWLARAVEAP